MSATPKPTRLGDAARHLRCVSALRNATRHVATQRSVSAPRRSAALRITTQRVSTQLNGRSLRGDRHPQSVVGSGMPEGISLASVRAASHRVAPHRIATQRFV